MTHALGSAGPFLSWEPSLRATDPKDATVGNASMSRETKKAPGVPGL